MRTQNEDKDEKESMKLCVPRFKIYCKKGFTNAAEGKTTFVNQNVLVYKCGYTNSRIRKSSALIYKCGYTNTRIRKSSALIYKCGYINSRIRKSK